MKDNKIFYKSECGKLIQYNKETETYCVKNSIKKQDKRISIDEFNTLNKIRINRQEYSRLMNIYFKDIKDTWTFDGVDYQSIDNFEYKNGNLSANYKIGTEIPYHEMNNKYIRNVILVYHWGRVYYHDISYNGYKQGQLYDINTLKTVQWCQLKNCSPVFNKQTKKIV